MWYSYWNYHSDYSDYVPLQSSIFFGKLFSRFMWRRVLLLKERVSKKCTTAFRFLVPLLFWLRNNGTMRSACSCLSEFLYTISLRDVGRRSHWHSPRKYFARAFTVSAFYTWRVRRKKRRESSEPWSKCENRRVKNR